MRLSQIIDSLGSRTDCTKTELSIAVRVGAKQLSESELLAAACKYIQMEVQSRWRRSTLEAEIEAFKYMREQKRRHSRESAAARRSSPPIEDLEPRMTIGQAVELLVEEIKFNFRAEWTAELLSSHLSMPDGRVITWGEATEADHADRLEMLKRNASANIEAASRHAHAIEYLRGAGVKSLNELAAGEAR